MIKEKESNPDVDMLFTGLMGGEYIKGITYDDYIIPKLLRLIEEKGIEYLSQIVHMLLSEKKINTDAVDINN